MMFIQLHVLNRRGANEPPEVQLEVIRIDLIQRIRPIEVRDVDDPCTELTLDGEEKVICQGELADVMAALDEAFK